MTMARRELLTMSLAAPLAVPGVAAAQSADPVRPSRETLPLWPDGPPGAPPALTRGEPRLRGTARPSITVHRPARPDGRAMLIVPGGGYGFVSLQNEGSEVADVLAAQGITGFVLDYRLPGDGWTPRADTPLADAQRAMRLIRVGATRFAINPVRLGVLGFSAGGHLAGSLATLHGHEAYRPVDAADRLSARPAIAGLMYAVSSLGVGRSNGGSRANLLGQNPLPEIVARYAVDRHIAHETMPLFVAHAADDATVPVINAYDLIDAARAAQVPIESHIFARGGHGFGTRLPRTMPGSLWPELFDRWSAEALGLRG